MPTENSKSDKSQLNHGDPLKQKKRDPLKQKNEHKNFPDAKLLEEEEKNTAAIKI